MFNYITCVITGSFVHGSFPVSASTFSQDWFIWACVMGGTFILLFNIIAFTAQRIGVAVASVANKLSLVIPFLFSIFLYDESSSILKTTGVILALLAVALTCFPSRKESRSSKTYNPLLLFVPIFLFAGSGLLDTMIKYVEQEFLTEENKNAYLITAFLIAGCIGVILLVLSFITGKQRFSFKAVIAGIAIGIPNYFSIWCLLKVLKQYGENSSAIIPINNMGIVLFSSVVAWLLFKEKLSAINWLGIIFSIAAIALIAFG